MSIHVFEKSNYIMLHGYYATHTMVRNVNNTIFLQKKNNILLFYFDSEGTMNLFVLQ